MARALCLLALVGLLAGSARATTPPSDRDMFKTMDQQQMDQTRTSADMFKEPDFNPTQAPIITKKTNTETSYKQIGNIYVDWKPTWCDVRRGELIGTTRNEDPVYQTFCSGYCINKRPFYSVRQLKFYDQRKFTELQCRPTETTTLKVKVKQQQPVYDDVARRKTYYKYTEVEVIKKCACAPPPCKVDGREYQNGEKWTSRCGEKCTCVNGEPQCCRVRKSFVSMSTVERRRYIDTVFSIAMDTAGVSGVHDEYKTLIKDHKDNFHAGIHTTDELLPWHRAFIKKFEDLLRKVDCRVTVPFWAWEEESANPWGSDLWLGTDYGFGGAHSTAVPDGGFAHPPFVLSPSAGSSTTLSRFMSGSVPSAVDVATMLAVPAASFTTFHSLINSMHGGVHCAVGGTMCQTISAEAPEFFLHHNNMDKLWAEWQDMSPDHAIAFSTGIDTPMTSSSVAVMKDETNPGAGTYTPRDLMDIRDHLGICVEYEEESPFTVIKDIIKYLPLDRIRQIPRKPLSADFYEHARTYLELHTMQSGTGIADQDDPNNILTVAKEFLERDAVYINKTDPTFDRFSYIFGADMEKIVGVANDEIVNKQDKKPVQEKKEGKVEEVTYVKDTAESIKVKERLEKLDRALITESKTVAFRPSVVSKGTYEEDFNSPCDKIDEYDRDDFRIKDETWGEDDKFQWDGPK